MLPKFIPVQITGAFLPSLWYAANIGETFNVISAHIPHKPTIFDASRAIDGNWIIYRSDCRIYHEKYNRLQDTYPVEMKNYLDWVNENYEELLNLEPPNTIETIFYLPGLIQVGLWLNYIRNTVEQPEIIIDIENFDLLQNMEQQFIG